MEELKKKTEAMLRAVLISSPRGVPLRRLDREYKSITFSSIPFQEMGYHSLEHYIKGIPKVAMLTRDVDGEFVVKGVASESDQHVAKLIAKQKKPKKKAKANSRRPVFARRPAVVTRPAMVTRQVFVTRPPVVQVVRPLPAAPRTIGTVARFIPPRMKKQAASQATGYSMGNNLIQRGVQQQAQTFVAATNSTRKVEVLSQPVFIRTLVQQPATSSRNVTGAPQGESTPKKNWKKKPRSPASGPNWQGMELAEGSDDRVVYLSNSSSSTNKIAPQSSPLSEEDLKIYSRIKQLIEDKPKGLWLKRIGAEYKKTYGDELSSDKLERLKTLPSIARCEEYGGGNTIVYPVEPTEEKPPTKPIHQTNGDSPRAVEVYTLRPQNLPAKGTSSEVSVSHVDNPSHFFIHHKCNWDTIDALSTNLNEFYQFQNHSGKTDLLLAVKSGMFCCAQFSEDDSWYRARITESFTKDDTSQVQVIYVDFGNHEPLPVSRLRMLRKEHAELPMMAVLCALDGAVPSGGETWSTASIDRFKELCAATEFLHMTVIRAEGHHLYVELKDTEGNDIKAVLQSEGHIGRDTPANKLSTSSSSSSSSNSASSSLTSSSSTDSFVSVSTVTSSTSSSLTNIVPTPDSSSSERDAKESEERKVNTRTFLRHRFLSKDEEAQNIPERVQIPDEQFLDVFVCNVHSTDNICVNLSGENYSEKLTALEQSMLCHYEEPSSEEVAKINPGSIFAIYSKEIHSEGLWYRVKVLKVKGDNVQIEYMDYGDTGMEPSSSLKNIPPRFLELPFQACTISLNGLPKTKNPEVVLKLKCMTLNKDLVAEVVKRSGNTASVELYDTSSEVADININTMLRSLVIPDEEMVPVLPKPGEQIDAFVTYVTPQGNIFMQERVQIPDEQFLDVFVCNVHSTDNICVNLSGENYSEKLTALEQSMLCHYEEPSSEEVAKINPGSIFAIYSKEIHSEGLWYRVKVLKVKGDNVQIEYMDYGDTGMEPSSSLKNIPPRFLELPFQACTISLNGLPKTKNPEVVLKLKCMTLNKDLVAEVVKRSGNTASVELYDTSSEVADMNINTMLRSLVIPDEEMVPVLPKPGEQIDAFVTYVTPQGNIFIQLPGGGTTRLEELMEDISEHYSQPTKAAEFMSNPHKDKMCCAKCSDGAWYRAIVTKVLPDRQVEVQYVDYGNTEQLPVSSLREPVRAIGHVNSLPFQALECKLEGTHKEALTEEQGYAIMERNVLLEVVQSSDVPLVRLFVPSEEDENTLLNLAELIGLESEKQAESQEEDSTSAGNDDAVSEPFDDGSVDGDSVASESSSDASKSPEEGDKMTIPPPLDFSKPWVDVSVLEFVDPSHFMFQCLELLKRKEELEKKIQEYYTGRSKTPFREVRPGVLCAVHNAEDDTWYRGVVKASLSPQQTCVRFADHGDFGIVPSTSLQALPDEFRELPLMAVQGCLHGVEPVGADLAEWSKEARRRFEELTACKKLVAKPRGVANHSRSTNHEETKISLELYDTSKGNEDVLIADVLVNEGLARRINET